MLVEEEEEGEYICTFFCYFIFKNQKVFLHNVAGSLNNYKD